jgi:integrase/recombinase XerD
MDLLEQPPVSGGLVGDDVLIRMWLHGRPANTAAAYRNDVTRFLAHAGKPLCAIGLADLAAWEESPAMAATAASSRGRRLKATKSLLAFGRRVGFLTLDVGAAFRVAKPAATAGERILTESQVNRLIGAEPDASARVLLRLLYTCGLRASEAAALCRRDLTARGKAGGEARILGKGSKLRTVGIPPGLWREIVNLGGARADAPVAPGRDGAAFDRRAVHRVVKRAARRAGLDVAVSAHWLRHSHASHALDHGAPVHVVQNNLGHASLATTTGYLHIRAGDSSAGYLPEPWPPAPAGGGVART